MPENNRNKSNRPKNSRIKIPRKWIAETVGCSENTVKAVQNGQRSKETDLGQKIEVAEILLEDGINPLLAEVKRIVQF